VEFKNPWNLLAEFNSEATISNARQRVFSDKSTRRTEGFEPHKILPKNDGNPHDDAHIDSQTSVPSIPELSQVVTAWKKLPASLKAAILAIIKTVE